MYRGCYNCASHGIRYNRDIHFVSHKVAVRFTLSEQGPGWATSSALSTHQTHQLIQHAVYTATAVNLPVACR